MSHNLRQQITHAVRESRAYGQAKHDAPAHVRHDGRTYSYNSFNNRLDVAKAFGTFMQSEHPEVRYARDLTPAHANEFLSAAAARGVADSTLDAYRSTLGAIYRECGREYGTRTPERGEIHVPERTAPVAPVRTVAMREEHIEQLRDSYRPYSTGRNAVDIAHACGARVEGISKLRGSDIHERADGSVYVHLTEKGGRQRDVDVLDPADRDRMRDLRDRYGTDRVCPARPESIDRSLSRHLHDLGIRDLYRDTTVHAIRKAWAQRTYDTYRQDHSKLEAIKYVNEQLGHSAERDVALLAHYVEDIH